MRADADFGDAGDEKEDAVQRHGRDGRGQGEAKRGEAEHDQQRAEGDDLAPARAQMLDGEAEALRMGSVGCVGHGASPLRPACF